MLNKCKAKVISFVCTTFLASVFFFAAFTVNAMAADMKISVGKAATSSSDFADDCNASYAIDGTSGQWCSAEIAPPHWLKIDLGEVCNITRYVVNHAHSAGDLAGYNTSSFKLQISYDGTNFTDLDIITGNTADTTDRNVTATARYVRLYITTPTQPGYGNIARIRELEIYGSVYKNKALKMTVTADSYYGAGSEPSNGVDGTMNQWASANTAPPHWLKVDLGATYNINRYVVYHAHYAGDLAIYNTRDFKFQVSSDGINFTDVDTITGNTADFTNRTVTATGRYIRLYITTPAQTGGGNIARIREFEVFCTVASNPRIVTTTYATDDKVIADYIVTDSPYNADKTGTNDSTFAIQRAIDDCFNSGGGTVWMPAGKYKVTSTINVRPFVTLRGDWQDPDSGTNYGTVIMANVSSSSSNTPGLFRIGGSAGCMGLTVYYPNQNASSPVAYPYTFEIPGRAWQSEYNYMMSSVINCTLLNSYKGICASLTPNDHGGDIAIGQVHEMANIVNVKGTVLYRGVEFQNAAEVDNFEDVKFNNSYWANAGPNYNAPSVTTLNTYTRANGIAFTFGDVEQDQFYGLTCSQYNIGIKTIAGQRSTGSGAFYGCSITNCNTAVEVTVYSFGWAFTRCTLSGSSYSIKNTYQPQIIVTDCTLSGSTYSSINLTISNPGTSPGSYARKSSLPKPPNNNFYNVLLSPYGADNTGTNDATSAIQSALNAAGSAGGGTVYLPAGRYRINTHLTVPANVELRGSSPIPGRDQTGLSAGTVICLYEGKGTAIPDTATAAITLNGTKAGVKGLRVWYPENNPRAAIYAYPFTIRGNASDVYAVDTTFVNTYNGIDFKTNCNNHYVRRVQGLAFRNGIVAGGTEGWVEGCLANATYVARTGFNNWMSEKDDLFVYVFPYTEANETWIKCENASNEYMLNNFEFGAHILASFTNSSAVFINAGGDNGTRGNNIGIEVVSGNVTVVNLLKSGGTNYTGYPTIYSLIRLA